MSTHFDGQTFEAQHDLARLSSQLERVKVLIADGQWRTLSEIRAACGGSEASLSARLRDLRKPRHGYIVDRRRRGNPADGLHEYQLRKKPPITTLFEM